MSAVIPVKSQIISPRYMSVLYTHSQKTYAQVATLLNDCVVIPLNTSRAGRANVFVYDAERLRVPKAFGEGWALFRAVYYNPNTRVFTMVRRDNIFAGISVHENDREDEFGEIRLMSVMQALMGVDYV